MSGANNNKPKATGPTVGSLQNELNLLKNKLKLLETANKELKESNTDLTNRVEQLESFRTTSATVTQRLKDENDQLREQIDSLDQYGRRSNLIIRHVPVSDNENPHELKETISSFLKDELKLLHASKDIDKLHRVGKPKTHAGRKQQNVIIRFRSHATRYQVYKERKSSKKFKVCPNLTRSREQTLYDVNRFIERNPTRP